jgi:guanylate kinase
MCCIGGKRGYGAHCLRYDYSTHYDMYEPLTNREFLEWRVVVTNGNQTSTAVVSSASPNTSGITMIYELAPTQAMPIGYISRDASQRTDATSSKYQ